MKHHSRFWIAFLVVIGLVVAGSVYRYKVRTPVSRYALATQELASDLAKTKHTEHQSELVSSLTQKTVLTNLLNELPIELSVLLNGSTGIDQRIAAAHTLTNHLSDLGLSSLYTFLIQRTPLDETPRGQYFKNEVMDALCKMSPFPIKVSDVLVQIYQDRGQNEVLRDYALQHLVPAYQQIEQAQILSNENRKVSLGQLQKVMWAALSETDSTIAGTALLDLSYLATESRSEFDRDHIAAKALELASNNRIADLTRITGFQVCVEMGNDAVLANALIVAQRGETISLRISAIAALGAFGADDNQVKIILENMLNDPEARLQLPIRVALKKIEQREAKFAKR